MCRFHHLIINTVSQNGKNAWKFYHFGKTDCFDSKTTEFLQLLNILWEKPEFTNFFSFQKQRNALPTRNSSYCNYHVQSKSRTFFLIMLHNSGRNLPEK